MLCPLAHYNFSERLANATEKDVIAKEIPLTAEGSAPLSILHEAISENNGKLLYNMMERLGL